MLNFKPTVALSALAAAAMLAAAPAQAAITVSSGAFNYAQSFDSLATTGTTVVWANDSTLPGWSLFNTNLTAVTAYLADDGTSNAGKFRSFGAAGSTERALGGVGSGSLSGWIAVAFDNATGHDLSGFKIGFDGEQWRNGGNTTLAAQNMVLQYGFGSSFATVANWVTPGGNFDWTSVVNTATAGKVDGNAAGLQAARGGVVNTSWAAGSTLWVRWAENNDAGNDHGLAIDNLSLSVIAPAVPEPSTYALLLAGLGTVGFMARRRRSN
ncbi:PEP-CTERM sorting domain-containing protein [Paucibacter sediminis]|uniref:PEP-CTERM sorting domain-containing protein n=1 Tax=Paucibacter sediminis TaxID=3019553 RepID=A0AA95NJJ9_9BURK|nr:PEP-CTERM sorting domain-containing protein [Paucibacter sp. S2-9]WIT10721.1 PEP-CTERM sorting domain-containing protein [Paucibacter sp. S2-9]